MHLIAWAGQFGSACFRSNIPSDLRNKTGLPSGREPQFPANGHRAGMSGRCRRGGFPHASRLFSNTRLSFSPKSASAAEGRAAGLDPTCRHAAGLAVTTPAQDEGREREGHAFSLSVLPILRFECATAVSDPLPVGSPYVWNFEGKWNRLENISFNNALRGRVDHICVLFVQHSLGNARHRPVPERSVVVCARTFGNCD